MSALVRTSDSVDLRSAYAGFSMTCLRGLAACAVALALTAPGPDLAAQQLDTFDWDQRSTVCYDGSPATQDLPLVDGVYQIPVDQFDAARNCRLVLVWTYPQASFNVAHEAVIQGLGRVIRQPSVLVGGVGAFRDQRTVKAEIPLSQLPQNVFRIGFDLPRANGEVHRSNPGFLTFIPGGETETAPPRIQSFRINSGESATRNEALRLDLTTSGAQPTQIAVREGPNHPEGFARTATSGGTTSMLADPLKQLTATVVSEDEWRPYAPTSGAFGGQQIYGLKDTAPGPKTIWVQVRSGRLVSDWVKDEILFAPVTTYDVDLVEVLRVAEASGFEHVAESTLGLDTCRISPEDGLAFLFTLAKENRDDVCKYTFFSGRKLATGWTVHSFTLRQAPGFSSRLTRQPRGDTPEGVVVVEYVGGSNVLSVGAFSFDLRLQGPVGAKWEDAFAR